MEPEAILTLFVTLFGAGGFVSILMKREADAHKQTVLAYDKAIERAAEALAISEKRATKWEDFALETFASLQMSVAGFGKAASAVETLAQK